MKTPESKKDLKQNNITEEKYLKAVQKNITHLDSKFLNLNSVTWEVKKSVFKAILAFGALFTMASFTVAFIFNIKSASEKSLENSIKKYDLSVTTLNESNKLLQEQLKNYDLKFKVFEDSLKSQANRIKKLKKK